jgi:glycine/D-amino acid oxidase-like deaminating enzyme
MPFLWGRPLGKDRLIFGGGLAFDAAKRVRQIDLRTPEVAQSLAHLEERVRELHPALADVQVDKRWGGPVAFRSNRSPILCRHESLPGLILSGAYAGHGIALSMRLGELAAQAILEDRALPDWGRVAWSSEALEVG